MEALSFYTTKIDAEKTIWELEKLLIARGAKQIAKDYDGKGSVTGVSFKIDVGGGLASFRLVAKVEEVMAVINEQTEKFRYQKKKSGGRGGRVRLVPKSFKNDRDHARRVAWRILFDCLRAQLTLVILGQAKVQEVLLPWMTDGSGRTLFEYMESANYQGLIEYQEVQDNA
ncbi:hypothetical protein LCGC14_1268140 [marine sediment metagenome]|uniref:Uncharacterized protein n=1 Tax=marine sediment metagenome TaxID=412755 RepID=A0A0F9LJS8_9ZZZZ